MYKEKCTYQTEDIKAFLNLLVASAVSLAVDTLKSDLCTSMRSGICRVSTNNYVGNEGKGGNNG